MQYFMLSNLLYYVECIVQYTNMPNQEPPLKQYNTKNNNILSLPQ